MHLWQFSWGGGSFWSWANLESYKSGVAFWYGPMKSWLGRFPLFWSTYTHRHDRLDKLRSALAEAQLKNKETHCLTVSWAFILISSRFRSLSSSCACVFLSSTPSVSSSRVASLSFFRASSNCNNRRCLSCSRDATLSRESSSCDIRATWCFSCWSDSLFSTCN